MIEDFRYRDDWYDLTDGLGFSLTAKNAAADPNVFADKSAWRPSAWAVARRGPATTASCRSWDRS